MSRKGKIACLIAEAVLILLEIICVVNEISFLVYPLFFLVIAPVALLIGASKRKDEY